MPRMDGFTLTEKVRHTEKLSHVPIVLCTSRGSKEDREHGIEVGANAYIDKSSFVQSSFLEIIKELL
jgi:two-component system chemotaxis sensor kinase CheA